MSKCQQTFLQERERFQQRALSIPGNIIFQLVPVNPLQFRTICYTEIKLLYENVSKTLEETVVSWTTLIQQDCIRMLGLVLKLV
jgi:hypothetical protein